MATYFNGHPRTRTNGRGTCGCLHAQMLRRPPTLVCTHHARWSCRGRTHYPACGLLYQHTSMDTSERARMASARAAVGMHKCWGDPRHWFAPTTPACRVVDACTTRRVDSYGHILLWPPQNTHAGPVLVARLGRTNVGGTPDTGLHPPRTLVASWTHAPPRVWTFMATFFYGHPRTRMNAQCTRRGWDAEMLGGPPTMVCTHHARWSRVDACSTRRVDFHGHMLLWPTQNTHEGPVHAARLGRTTVGGTSDTGLHPPRPLVASWTPALPGAWTSMDTYFYGHLRTRTNGQCTRRGWDAKMLGGRPTLVCTRHPRSSRRERMHHPACGLLWPHTSVACPERARRARAHGAVWTHKCCGDPRYCFAPTTSAS